MAEYLKEWSEENDLNQGNECHVVRNRIIELFQDCIDQKE